MDLEGGIQGLIHLSEISHGVVKDIRDYVRVGEDVTAKIINFEPKKKRIGLSLKALQDAPESNSKDQINVVESEVKQVAQSEVIETEKKPTRKKVKTEENVKESSEANQA